MYKALAASALLLAALGTEANARCFVASHYGSESGNKTASGERFIPSGMTAAHRSLPFGTLLTLHYKNGRHVTVRINDRGPFIRGRTLDVSTGAARALGFSGVATLCE